MKKRKPTLAHRVAQLEATLGQLLEFVAPAEPNDVMRARWMRYRERLAEHRRRKE